MSGATPGPWERRDTPDYAEIIGGGHAVAMVARADDANLIAEAPALLAGCVAMLGYMESGFLVRDTKNDADSDWALKALAFVKDLKDMHAAVAKATGESP